jgi:hypothetical protein
MSGTARWRRQGVCAAASAGAAALLALLALPLPALAADPAPEGPPGPAAKRVLVLPTRVPARDAEERATFDLLLATALHELDLTVIDAREVVRKLDDPGPDLASAREMYLGLKLDAALEAAAKARAAHLAHQGDLLGDPGLTEAELMMVRILLDLGRQREAGEIAAAVLDREPALRLDPVDNPPAMQALWLAALERRGAAEPREHDVDALAAAAREAGADYAVAGVRKRTARGADWLVVQIVPATAAEKPSRQPLRLGPRGSWARDVQGALEVRFGPAKSETVAAQAVPLPATPAPEDKKEKKVWYKTWWFWTSVGIVVVGGVAVGVGAWASSKDGLSIDYQGQ